MKLPKQFLVCILFATLFLLLISSSVNCQVKIKEKIGINPTVQKSKLSKSTAVTEYLWIRAQSTIDAWSAVVQGPCGVNGSMSGSKASVGETSIPNPPAGHYKLFLTTHFTDFGDVGPCGVISYEAGYTGWGYNSPGPGCFIAYPYQCANGQSSQTTEFDFTLDYLNDFIPTGQGTICENEIAGIEINNLITLDDCEKLILFGDDPTITLNITSQNPDLVFYDGDTQQILGKNVTIQKSKLWATVIKLNSPYDGPDTDVDVGIEINGVNHSASVHVFADTYFYSIYPEYNEKSILLGQRFMNTVFASANLNEICTKHELSSLVKYNVEIVDGQQFGHLIDPTTKNRASSLTNLNHDNGKLDFEFSADSFDVNGTNNVVLKISTNKATIEPFYVTYHIARAKIQVTFSPPTLNAGDTAKVILKYINDDGTLSDFSPDKYFDAQIIEGKDYGTFISPESSDTLDQLSCVYQGFKFIANKKIPTAQVQSTIIVNTTVFSASKIIPGKDGLNKNVSTVNKSISKLKKTTSTKDDEQLWGMGTVSIVKPCDCKPECSTNITLYWFSVKWNFGLINQGEKLVIDVI